jgi:hypothetical protein
MHPESMRADVVTISICAKRMIVFDDFPHHGEVCFCCLQR